MSRNKRNRPLVDYCRLLKLRGYQRLAKEIIVSEVKEVEENDGVTAQKARTGLRTTRRIFNPGRRTGWRTPCRRGRSW